MTWVGLCEVDGCWEARGGRTRRGSQCEAGGGRTRQMGGGRRRRARARALGARVRRARARALGTRVRRARAQKARVRGHGGERGGHGGKRGGCEGARVRGLVGGGCQIRDPNILVHYRCKKTWRRMWQPVMAEARASPTQVLPVLNA